MDWAFVPAIGNILIVVDAYSGWIEAFPTKDRSADSVINSLRTVFTRFGVPELVVSDNAAEFTSAPLLAWLERNGARKMESPPYSPQSNGAAERAVQTIKKALQAWTQRLTHGSFVAFLQKALLHHRNSSTSRGRTPAELVLGRRLRVPVVSTFQQGDPVQFKANGDTNSSRAEFLMSQGRNTSWLLTGAKLQLASNNQFGPLAPASETDEEEDAVHQQPQANMPEVPPEIAPARRSTRARNPPNRFVP